MYEVCSTYSVDRRTGAIVRYSCLHIYTLFLCTGGLFIVDVVLVRGAFFQIILQIFIVIMINKLLLATAVCLILVVQAQPASVLDLLQLRPAIPGYGAGSIFKDCSASGDKFKLKNVLVKGCTAVPCILTKGTNVTIEIDFESEDVVTAITAKVYGQIGGTDIPFPITQPDACKCGVQCPTKVGALNQYVYQLPVLSAYPSMELVVYWYMYDQNNVEALCMDVLVKIQ